MLSRLIRICVPGEVRSAAYTGPGSLLNPTVDSAACAFEMDHGAFPSMSPELTSPMISNATPPALKLVAKPRQKHSGELRSSWIQSRRAILSAAAVILRSATSRRKKVVLNRWPVFIYRETRNVAAVSRMLGHTSLAHTLGYLGVPEDEVFDLARKFDI